MEDEDAISNVVDDREGWGDFGQSSSQGQLGFLHCCTHLSLKFTQLKESQIFKAAFVIKVSKAKYSAQASFIQPWAFEQERKGRGAF